MNTVAADEVSGFLACDSTSSAAMRYPHVRQCVLSLLLVFVSGCYFMRASSGGGETEFVPPRHIDAADVLVPDGFMVEVVADSLTFPTGVAIDDGDRPHVVESGYSYGEVFTFPRLLRVETDGSLTEIARGTNGPWNGLQYHEGYFYVAGGHVEGGEILRISPDGHVQPLITGLPSYGDHHTNGPAISSDGFLYFGQGTATNSGVVGVDNYEFGWLRRNPSFHDIPCSDIALTGVNFKSPDPLDDVDSTTSTGAFSAFGTPTTEGQVIAGEVPCSGSILRIDLSQDDPTPELVAWGFRNPYGLAFSPDGGLFITENGYDDRGSRPAWGTGDYLWKIEEGAWYGWPDFSGGVPLGNFSPPDGPEPQMLLADHPGEPPEPAALLGVHSSSNGFDISRTDRFGFAGDAFIAQFGDLAPDVGKVLAPVGFRVVRVETDDGTVHGFMENRHENSPASRIGSGGIERPIAARFDQAGETLYVVDFGVMTVGDNGPRPRPNTGVLWSIQRSNTRLGQP